MARRQNKSLSNIEQKKSIKSAKRCKPSISINDIQGLQGLRDIESSKYASVKNTDDSYGGQLDRGRRFLKDLVEKRRENAADRATDGICTNLLKNAFDNPPNEHSALALEMFLVQKCFNEKRRGCTADSIHGAFTRLWDNM